MCETTSKQHIIRHVTGQSDGKDEHRIIAKGHTGATGGQWHSDTVTWWHGDMAGDSVIRWQWVKEPAMLQLSQPWISSYIRDETDIA